MRTVITNFLFLNVQVTHPAVYWGMVLAYFFVLVSAVLSLRQQLLSNAAKLGWFLVIFLLPLCGVAAYAMRCIWKADWSFMKPIFQTRSKSVMAVTKGLEAKPLPPSSR